MSPSMKPMDTPVLFVFFSIIYRILFFSAIVSLEYSPHGQVLHTLSLLDTQ